MRVLFIGDIVGQPGRKIVARHLLALRQRESIQLVIANAENASGGKGLTPANFQELVQAGVDVVTLGDHVWDKKEIIPLLSQADFLLRPANYPSSASGKGAVVLQIQRQPVAILVLQGRVFMNPPIDCPFQCADRWVPALKKHTPILIVEMHAETTSEKMAMAWYLNGKASAVIGTHTHIPTSDYRILPEGTAYITDVGMTGPVDSVIGMQTEDILQRYLSGMHRPFRVAKKGNVSLNSVLLNIDDDTGRALSIHPIWLSARIEALSSPEEENEEF